MSQHLEGSYLVFVQNTWKSVTFIRNHFPQKKNSFISLEGTEETEAVQTGCLYFAGKLGGEVFNWK